jgi:hypothetical protein
MLCPLCYPQHVNYIIPGETPDQAIDRFAANWYNAVGVLDLERLDRAQERKEAELALESAGASVVMAHASVEAARKSVEDALKLVDAEREKTMAAQAATMEVQQDLMKEKEQVVADLMRITVLENEITKLGGVVPPDEDKP